MRIALSVEGGRDDELEALELAVAEELREEGVRTARSTGEVEPGALGAEEILLFVGTNVLLPVTLTALYDYVKARLRGPQHAGLRFHLVRTDLPDGTRRIELTAEGEAQDVAAVLKELQ
ncbi:hypothetical protein ACFQLX_18145 [Streptomyces polyrhachis]|uniref:Uncharacterized protein n=1 Tax=Streptomyces polyrhachis TaxID=1282885 RepID=A0ABW2GH80_9ACTN